MLLMMKRYVGGPQFLCGQKRLFLLSSDPRMTYCVVNLGEENVFDVVNHALRGVLIDVIEVKRNFVASDLVTLMKVENKCARRGDVLVERRRIGTCG